MNGGAVERTRGCIRIGWICRAEAVRLAANTLRFTAAISPSHDPGHVLAARSGRARLPQPFSASARIAAFDRESCMATSAEYGFGEYAFPRGWFMVANSSDITNSKPYNARYFGEDAVIFRNAAGAVGMIGAYCPHMGTHFGTSKTSYIVTAGFNVQGDGIRCPFHGWRFGLTASRIWPKTPHLFFFFGLGVVGETLPIASLAS